MVTIVIDPGHYGAYNKGVCPGYYEGYAMLKLSKYLAEELRKRGANVLLTRTTDSENPSLEERGMMGAGADLFISMHSDASENSSVRGVTSYYSIQQPDSRPFADNIGMAAANAMGNQFRGSLTLTYPGNPALDYFGVLRAAVRAGAKNAFLIEHGYHTNPEDCAILNSDAGLRRIAQAEADVIAFYFALTGGAIPSTCRFYYSVQPGESLYLIGQKFGVSWQAIASTNGIVAPYQLMVGQRLTIPLPVA